MLTSLLQCSYIHPVRLNVYIVTQFQRRGFLEYSGPHRDPCCVSQKSVNLFKSRNHDLNSGTSSRPTSQPARYLTWLSEAPSPLADPLDSPPSIDEGQSPDGCVRSLAPRSSSGPAQHTEVTQDTPPRPPSRRHLWDQQVHAVSRAAGRGILAVLTRSGEGPRAKDARLRQCWRIYSESCMRRR